MKKAILAFILAFIIGAAALTAVGVGAIEPGEITIETESNLVIGTEDGCITGIAPGTTAAALIANFENTSQLAVVNSQGGTVTGNIIVGTGCKLRLVIGGTSVDEYTLIVTGDADGDGEMSLKDAIHILRILAGWKLVNYDAASDFNGDGRMNAMDAVQVLRKLADWNVDIYPLVNVRPPVETFTVTFKDYDGRVIAERTGIVKGGSATAPTEPTREGYDFAGWDKAYTNITADTTVTATYTPKPAGTKNVFKLTYEDVGDNRVTVTLKLTGTVSANYIKGKITYDSSVLTYKSITGKTKTMTGNVVHSAADEAIAFSLTKTANVTEETVLFKATFSYTGTSVNTLMGMTIAEIASLNDENNSVPDTYSIVVDRIVIGG